MNNKPTIKHLNRHVTPQYAAYWKEIGVELDLPAGKLSEIGADYPLQCKRCCSEMLAEWLKVDLNASWKKLFDALESFPLEGKLIRL